MKGTGVSALWNAFLLLAAATGPTFVVALTEDAPMDMGSPVGTSNGKIAIRLVYSENFAALCSAQDSTDLFDVVTAVLPSSRRRQLRLRSLEQGSNDCSMECAWIGEGKCSVMKPWYVAAFLSASTPSSIQHQWPHLFRHQARGTLQ